jgi:hypothetical protein
MAKEKETEVPPTPAAFDDEEFFKSEGVTDDAEKDAIRSRARVLRYAGWRSEKEKAAKPPEKKSDKKWYQKD